MRTRGWHPIVRLQPPTVPFKVLRFTLHRSVRPSAHVGTKSGGWDTCICTRGGLGRDTGVRSVSRWRTDIEGSRWSVGAVHGRGWACWTVRVDIQSLIRAQKLRQKDRPALLVTSGQSVFCNIEGHRPYLIRRNRMHCGFSHVRRLPTTDCNPVTNKGRSPFFRDVSVLSSETPVSREPHAKEREQGLEQHGAALSDVTYLEFPVEIAQSVLELGAIVGHRHGSE
jgi:hypothetical protein